MTSTLDPKDERPVIDLAHIIKILLEINKRKDRG